MCHRKEKTYIIIHIHVYVTVYYKYVFSLIHAIITYDVTVIC